MKTVTLKLPDTFDMNDKDLIMVLASKLYEDGKLSLGQAADLVGLSKRSFSELLGKNGVSIFNYPASEIARDVKNASHYNL
jgi:predicted HTH domain antitoxin